MSDETTLNFATGNSMLDAQLPTRLVSMDLFEFISCETVLKSLWKTAYDIHKLFSAYFHKLFRLAYENNL